MQSEDSTAEADSHPARRKCPCRHAFPRCFPRGLDRPARKVASADTRADRKLRRCASNIVRDDLVLLALQYSMSGKSWVLPQSASEYNMGTGVTAGVSIPGGRWGTGSVPASASLYSMASGSSSISGGCRR